MARQELCRTNAGQEAGGVIGRAHHFIAATACQEADYGWMIRHYCLKQFQLSMEGIGQRLWCDWDETVGTYGELTNCTALIAERLNCYWPNRLVDEFFVAVHKQYFRNCSPSGRALHDPPNGVLCPFIVLPILVTLLMTERHLKSEACVGWVLPGRWGEMGENRWWELVAPVVALAVSWANEQRD
ncbi:PREDICTED: receptor activity-modifying protein 1 [Nipponia nippon]|uniref:receptor activity-modifying protein 1 n=1 Tax=Nipponia nippon TaxID=128390 RepID=UPI000510BC4D|nr:PREDICTED: receptor activity-modifying protein 1 [Nipponia nippon]